MSQRRLSDKLTVHEDNGHYVFENSRGLMVNGNRRLHMANWEVNDIRDIWMFLMGQPDCKCIETKHEGESEHWPTCRYA